MKIEDRRITGIYKIVCPLEKGGFYCEIRESCGSVLVYVFIHRKWLWGWISYTEKIGVFHPKESLSVDRLYVRECHNEVVEMLEKIPEFKDILIILEGQKDVGGTRVVT